MKLLIITDAWTPQINGVVRTLKTTISILRQRGFQVDVITPDDFKTFALPSYPEIRIPLSTRDLREKMTEFDPRYIHIATEGRLGWAARAICLSQRWHFTTAYHTDFPEYLKNYYRVPKSLTYGVLKCFHKVSNNVMVSTDSVSRELDEQGFGRIVKWGRGVDTALFYNAAKPLNEPPIVLSVGRVSKEKNLMAFLDLDITAKKVVVGDGPELQEYREQYPDVVFTGSLSGEELALAYRNADVFVFPSRSDTFGLVIIEALASGTPVAAYPVKGPIDILNDRVGVMDDDLAVAIDGALKMKHRYEISRYGQSFTWDRATDQFVNALVIK